MTWAHCLPQGTMSQMSEAQTLFIQVTQRMVMGWGSELSPYHKVALIPDGQSCAVFRQMDTIQWCFLALGDIHLGPSRNCFSCSLDFPVDNRHFQVCSQASSRLLLEAMGFRVLPRGSEPRTCLHSILTSPGDFHPRQTLRKQPRSPLLSCAPGVAWGLSGCSEAWSPCPPMPSALEVSCYHTSVGWFCWQATS